MRLVCIVFFLIAGGIQLKAQSIYEQYTHANYRTYKEFNTIINPQQFDAELLSAAIFFATNEIRVKKRLPALSYHHMLEHSAQMHSNDMVKYKFFSHTNPKVKKHREPTNRAKIAGISNPYIAENITEGFVLKYKANSSVITVKRGVFQDPKSHEILQAHTYLSLADELLDAWMHSKGHRANILSKDAVQLGCGAAYYVMRNFNDMPAVKATQNFQFFKTIQSQ